MLTPRGARGSPSIGAETGSAPGGPGDPRYHEAAVPEAGGPGEDEIPLQGSGARTGSAAGGGLAGYDRSAPYLLRGTVSGRLWPGVEQGRDATPKQRRINLASLQAAVDHASSRRKFFELEPGLYEIEGTAGLVVPPSKDGFVWRGSKGSMLKQFSNDCAVLTVGDIDGSMEIQDMDLRGVRVFYALDQSGHARSSALRLGLIRNSTIEQVSVLADYGKTGPLVKAHRGVHIVNASHTMGFFSNTVRDVFVGGASRSLLDISLVGTGSVFSNIYLTQGVTGSPMAVSGNPLRIAGTADQYETVFEQLNIEWCIAETIIHAQKCRATTFLSTHLEGNRLAGRSPRVVSVVTSEINVIGANILDQEVRGSDVIGDAIPCVFQCYGDTSIAGSNLQISWSGPNKVDIPFHLVGIAEASPPDAHQCVNMTNLVAREVGGANTRFLGLDHGVHAARLPLSGAAVDRYTYRAIGSEVAGAKVSVNADLTVFGQCQAPFLRFPSALGATRTVTLSNRMAGGGLGSTIPTQAGSLAAIRRSSGAGDAYDLIVKNHDGAVLSTVAAASAGSTRWFRFGGADWTPVA